MAQRITNPDEGILLSELARVDPQLLTANDLFTGLHNGVNANFRLVDVASYVAAGIDLNPGEPPEWHPPDPITGEYVTYSVLIDHSKTDPYRMVEYADDALNLNGTWERAKNMPIFKNLKNCVLKDGVVQYYLKRNDVTQDEDGNDVTTEIKTLGNDVMLEFPERLGYRFHWETEDILKVSVTNRPAAAGFNYDAFSYLDYNDCSKVYLGRYKATYSNDTLYSCNDIFATTRNLRNWEVDARFRGMNYGIQTWSIRTLWTCLVLIVFKNLNIQTALHYGSGSASTYKSGYGNKSGWDNKYAVYSNSVSCLGLEGAWDAYREWVFGIKARRNREATDTTGYEYLPTSFYVYNYGGSEEWRYAGEGMPQYASPGQKNPWYGYVSRVHGTNDLGFLPSRCEGSTTTKYCDYGHCNINQNSINTDVFLFFGHFSSGLDMGLFDIGVADTAATTRLMYFHRG